MKFLVENILQIIWNSNMKTISKKELKWTQNLNFKKNYKFLKNPNLNLWIPKFQVENHYKSMGNGGNKLEIVIQIFISKISFEIPFPKLKNLKNGEKWFIFEF